MSGFRRVPPGSNLGGIAWQLNVAPRPLLGTGLFVLPAALCSIEFEKAETTKEACEMTEQLKEIAIRLKTLRQIMDVSEEELAEVLTVSGQLPYSDGK